MIVLESNVPVADLGVVHQGSTRGEAVARGQTLGEIAIPHPIHGDATHVLQRVQVAPFLPRAADFRARQSCGEKLTHFG